MRIEQTRRRRRPVSAHDGAAPGDRPWPARLAAALLPLLGWCAGAPADDAGPAISFRNLGPEAGTGIHYARGPSANKRILDSFKAQGIVDFAALPVRSRMPGKPRGAPGVAVLDYDLDGDLDIYVTNGPGRANSLFSNQLRESGRVAFRDVAAASHTALTGDDSTGVCFGDIDNDGDPDLLVLNIAGANRLLENEGDGTFAEIGTPAGVADDAHHPVSCAMGDVNGDGYLDFVVANTYDNLDHRLPLMTFDHAGLMEPNQLYLNQGGRRFSEVGAEAGVGAVGHVTWAVTLVDYDGDGDVDLVTADDQGAKAPARYGGVDDGYVRLYRNDGTGHFTDVTRQEGLDRFGAWMGLAVADLDHDGRLDIFATNAGYYFPHFLEPLLGFPSVVGEWASGWFLARPEGGVTFPGVGDLVGTPFGWGVSVADLDNDNDVDVLYYGGIDMGAYIDASNPGVVLRNDGQGGFDYDSTALAGTTDHRRRSVQGVATGDFDNDGFVDIVTVASQRWPEPLPLAPYLPPARLAGTPFDAGAAIWPVFVPVDPTDLSAGFMATGLEPSDGDLVVEMNNGNDNHWVSVTTLGTAGLTPGGRVNRDGIGAVVRFRPHGGATDTRPVLGGSSYASQDSRTLIFGLGDAGKGVLDIQWPGGRRNRLYGARAGESIVFPEIPCSYDDRSLSAHQYRDCVSGSLQRLVGAGLISGRQGRRFMVSAIRARRHLHAAAGHREKRHMRHPSNRRMHDEMD